MRHLYTHIGICQSKNLRRVRAGFLVSVGVNTSSPEQGDCDALVAVDKITRVKGDLMKTQRTMQTESTYKLAKEADLVAQMLAELQISANDQIYGDTTDVDNSKIEPEWAADDEVFIGSLVGLEMAQGGDAYRSAIAV
ncbi:MAG: hypothetical protein H7144_05825 [Burkholderiales bacterium]|nr:hypothetical protein [Phycisphaerae bacterium]